MCFASREIIIEIMQGKRTKEKPDTSRVPLTTELLRQMRTKRQKIVCGLFDGWPQIFIRIVYFT